MAIMIQDGAKGAAKAVPFETAATQALAKLQRAIVDLFQAGPLEVRKASDLETHFGLDRRLSWQIHRTATAPNPLAAGTSVPPRTSIERFLKIASRKRKPSDAIDRVLQALDEFEEFVGRYAGDRETLTAMLSAYAPESREKNELAAKEAMFRAISQIRGVVVETELEIYVMAPTADGSRVDETSLSGEFGLRRTRPNAHVAFGSGDYDNPVDLPHLTLGGQPGRTPADFLLPQFCSLPTPPVQASTRQDRTSFFIPGNDVGLQSAADLVFANFQPASMKRYRESDGKRLTGHATKVDTPTRRLTRDFFIHKDIYPIPPRLDVYEIVTRGRVTAFDDPSREQDRLEMLESIQSIPGGLSHAQANHIPKYRPMLDFLCGKLNHNPAEFRGYRLDVMYPVYGSAYIVGFELPERPLG
jgi:hypothetical protein